MTDPALLRRRMVEGLARSEALRPKWRDAFLSVPRHEFIPDTVWQEDDNSADVNDLIPLHRDEDPGTWLELAYADDAVIIQVDDGVPVGPGLNGHDISSSASMPTMVARMLGELEIEPGMNVCEIGTGTGYNAALLAAYLGAHHVTTIEVDPQIAGRAEQALAATGFGEVAIVRGDGTQGYPLRAPYDRILSTAAVGEVPYGWVEQTRPGGRIVTPWGTPYYNGGLLALTVAENGTAMGQLIGPASFMMLRDQRIPRVSVRRYVRVDDDAVTTCTDLHPHRVAGHYDVCIAIGILVPRCKYLYWPASWEPARVKPGLCNPGEGVLWFLDPWSRSWASLHHQPDVAADSYRVCQFGPRNLWAEVEAAYRWWAAAGEPTADRWNFVVTQQRQRIGLSPG